MIREASYECRSATCSHAIATFADTLDDNREDITTILLRLANMRAEQVRAERFGRVDTTSKVALDAILDEIVALTGDAERAEYEVMYRAARTYGPPENCFPAENIEDPTCPVCGDQSDDQVEL